MKKKQVSQYQLLKRGIDNKTLDYRYSDIAYMAGIKNTVTMFASLGLIKGMDEKK